MVDAILQHLCIGPLPLVVGHWVPASKSRLILVFVSINPFDFCYFQTQVWTYASKLEETQKERDEAPVSPKTAGKMPSLCCVASLFDPCYSRSDHR